MLNPDIFVLGVRIAEPVTTVTDILTAIIAFAGYLGLRDFGNGPVRDRETYLFSWYFFLLGMAMLLSGFFGHAFRYALPDSWRLFGWTLSGAAILTAELATNHALLQERSYSHPGFFSLIPWIQFTVFFILLLRTSDFRIVRQNSTIGLILYVLPLQYLMQQASGSAGRRLIITGIIVGLLPAITFTRQISISRWFNHHDISHILMGLVIFLMYRGAFLTAEERQE